MSELELQARLDLAVETARQAGELTLRYFRRHDLIVEQKGDQTPVTIADREAEQLVRRRVKECFPGDAVLGEEFAETAGESGYRWIVDPIDGTQSFVRGVPLYGTVVAVERGGRSVIGVIHIPPLKECVYAAQGLGAWHEREGLPRTPARVGGSDRLDESLFCTSDPSIFAGEKHHALLRLLQATRLTRTWGDCYGYLLVATGRAELMIDPVANLWDLAALQPILEEAGGTFTDWRGNPTIYSGEGIATNGKILRQVLAVLQDPSSP